MEKYMMFAFVDETATVIACKAMNQRYPNVHFEGVEDGTGRYTVYVVPLHGKHIFPETQHIFREQLLVSYETACVAIREFQGKDMS